MKAEFSRPLARAAVPAGGKAVRLSATPAERAALAKRFRILAIDSLAGELLLLPEPGGALRAHGQLSAAVVQACVVSLEPVEQQVEAALDLRFLPPGAIPTDDAEGPDEIEPNGETIDLGEALAEQLALALDPYPRAAAAAADEAQGWTEPAPGPWHRLAALRRQ